MSAIMSDEVRENASLRKSGSGKCNIYVVWFSVWYMVCERGTCSIYSNKIKFCLFGLKMSGKAILVSYKIICIKARQTKLMNFLLQSVTFPTRSSNEVLPLEDSRDNFHNGDVTIIIK